MPATKLQDLLDPQVLTDMISAKLDKKIRAIPYAKVDSTLQGRPGSTITVPQFIFDEVAGDVPEGTDIPVRKLGTRMAQYTIKKAGLGAPVTDEAIECGYGDPVGAAGTGIVNGIRARTDIDAFEEMLKASVTYDATAEPVAADRALCYNAIVRGVDRFMEEVASEKVMFVHPLQMTTLRLDPNFVDKTKYGNNVMVDGEIGMVGNTRLLPSKRVACFGGCFYNPILKLNADEETEDEIPALTFYIKRNVNVETERKVRRRMTEITADEMYVVALTNDSRVVLVKTAGAPLTTEQMLEATYAYPNTAYVFSARGVESKLVKTGAAAYTLNLRGECPKAPAGAVSGLSLDAGTTHVAVLLVGIPDAPLKGFDPTKVKYNDTAMAAKDVTVIGGIPYLVLLRSLWLSGGAVTGAGATFTLAYGTGAPVTFTWSYDGLTLSTKDLDVDDD